MEIFVNARFLTQPVTGVQRYAIECSRQIKKIYPQAVFLTPHNIYNKDVASELGARVIGRRTGHFWEQLDLPWYLARHGAPALFNPANTAPLAYSNNYLTLHDLAFYHHPEWNSKAFSAWYNILVPRIVQRARHLFTVSNTMREEIIKYYKVPPAKISVTYNGLSPAMLAGGGAGHAQKERIVLSVGSFNTRKNHQNLVKAFAASNIKGEYQLAIIGDKNKVFSESGLDEDMLVKNNIKIYQRLSEDELIRMYQKAEVLVSLSMYEGFGIPLLEGIYNGCRIVCSDIPVYRELYDGYATFCDPYDINGISAALERVVRGKVGNERPVSELLSKYDYANAAKGIVDTITKDKDKSR